jgi:putative nucleotidyltransferase with HDIG domain
MVERSFSGESRPTKTSTQHRARRPISSRAFRHAERFPALSQTRRLALAMLARGRMHGLCAAIESDVALTAATLRLANEQDHESVASVADALQALELVALSEALRSVPNVGFFGAAGFGPLMAGPFVLHALDVRDCARRLSGGDGASWGELTAAALLHDIGKVALAGVRPQVVIHELSALEQGLCAERQQLQTDHASVGAELARRWFLPERLTRTIEQHHADAATGSGAIVRLADMVAHFQRGRAIDLVRMRKAAEAAGVPYGRLESIIPGATGPIGLSARTESEPSPLTAREAEILQQLAFGSVYKQIAAGLGMSPSTVRVHLHNVYAKLGVGDRAQAVLVATDRGWLTPYFRTQPF